MLVGLSEIRKFNPSGRVAGNACSLLLDRRSQITTGAPALNRDGNSWARLSTQPMPPLIRKADLFRPTVEPDL